MRSQPHQLASNEPLSWSPLSSQSTLRLAFRHKIPASHPNKVMMRFFASLETKGKDPQNEEDQRRLFNRLILSRIHWLVQCESVFTVRSRSDVSLSKSPFAAEPCMQMVRNTYLGWCFTQSYTFHCLLICNSDFPCFDYVSLVAISSRGSVPKRSLEKAERETH